MLIYGGIFGCLSPILSISAFLSYKSPFVYPKDEVLSSTLFWICFFFAENICKIICFMQKQNVERAKLALLTNEVGGANDQCEGNRQSDHLLMMVAYMKWEKIQLEVGYLS